MMALTNSTPGPKLKVLPIEEQVPSAEVDVESEAPTFGVSSFVDPVPTTSTKVGSPTPEVRVRAIVDLKPRIVDGDD